MARKEALSARAPKAACLAHRSHTGQSGHQKRAKRQSPQAFRCQGHRSPQERPMTLVALYTVVMVLCGLLVLVSYADRLYTESGKFLSREFQENIEAFEKLVEPRLLRASQPRGPYFFCPHTAHHGDHRLSLSAISSFETPTGSGRKLFRRSSALFWSSFFATGFCRTCSSRARAACGSSNLFRCCRA